MKKGTIFSVILTLLFFSNTSLASTIELPKPSGNYQVGTKAIMLEDSARKMLRDSNNRTFMVQAFYPTDSKVTQTYPYRPNTLKNGMINNVKVMEHSIPNAPIVKNKLLPIILSIILFIPGLGHGRQDYTILCEELASKGYVVISLDQPYVTNFVQFTDGKKIGITAKDAWKVRRDRDYRYKFYDEAMEAAIGDIKFILDNFDKLNSTHFSNQLNKGLITIMGHSFGGNVAHTIGFTDKRIKTVVDIDSKITERRIYGHIGVPPNQDGKPVLFIRATMQYQDDVGDSLTKVKHADIKEFNVEHSAFSDNAFLSMNIKGFGKNGFLSQVYNWLFTKGPFFNAVDIDLGGNDTNKWYREFTSIIYTWLKKN
jgi:hypothetical protein